MAYPLQYDWICYLVDEIPTGLRRRVENIQNGVDIETALQGMTAEEIAEVVRWAGKAAGHGLYRPAL